MKTAVIFLGLFVAFAAADTECPLMDAIERSFDNCANMTNADNRMMENVMRGQGINDQETNCFRACIMQEAGLLKRGKVDVDRMEDMMHSCIHPKVRMFVAFTKFCKPRVEVTTDGCLLAHFYMRCYEAVDRYVKNSQANEAAAQRAEEQKDHENRHKNDK